MQSKKPDVAALVLRMPDSDEPGKTSKFTGPDPAEAAKVFEEILAGGADAVADLIGLIRDTADPAFKDYRAQYVLHGLALHAGGPGNEEGRKALAAALTAALDRDIPKVVKAIVIREIQVIGGPEAVAPLGARLADDDLADPAAQALLAIGQGAAEEFRRALPGAKGKTRVTIVQALGVLRDKRAGSALRDAAGEKDAAVRMAAVWALARIADPGSVDVVVLASGAEDGWERTQAVKACLLLAERLAADKVVEEARRIYVHLRDTRKDPKDEYIRRVAEIGLLGLKLA
jgi:HEAT repeat protein